MTFVPKVMSRSEMYRNNLISSISTMEDLLLKMYTCSTSDGRSLLPLQECRLASASSKRVLDMLDSAVAWQASASISLNEKNLNESIPEGASQELEAGFEFKSQELEGFEFKSQELEPLGFEFKSQEFKSQESI